MEFPSWVKKVGGISSAARILKEKPRTVASWVRAERAPLLSSAINIVVKSEREVDFNDIYLPIARLSVAGRELVGWRLKGDQKC